jgi:N6-L-threonylcarbamoyladenine synthase
MLVLGIETSCDETAAAVVEDGRRVRSDVVASQVLVHAEFGGVVPEVASRQHLATVIPVLRRAVADAGVALADLDGLAVTNGPGLVGALLVGVEVAKALGFALDKPVVGVNHLAGHLAAAFIDDGKLPAR